MNKPVYVGLSISDLSKSAMFGFWYNHVKPKYGENPKLIIWIETASLFM